MRIVFIAFILLLGSKGIAKDNPVDQMAQELVKLRGEVETLYNDLEALRSERRNKAQSVGFRMSDLETKLQREEIQAAKFKEQLATLEEKMNSKDIQGKDLIPIVERQLELIEEKINRGLPFRKVERLAAVEEIKNITETYPAKALMQTWSLIEDELRVRKEVGVFKEVVQLGDEQSLAEIAKIGMNSVMFKTSNGIYGYVAPQNGQYRYVVSNSPAEVQAIEKIFELFKQNSRQGFFEIPFASMLNREVL